MNSWANMAHATCRIAKTPTFNKMCAMKKQWWK